MLLPDLYMYTLHTCMKLSHSTMPIIQLQQQLEECFVNQHDGGCDIL
jgi:hypothetical protein